MPTTYPAQYELQNNSDVKLLNIVVKFEGIDTLFSLQPTYKKLRYGDPDAVYGGPGLVYGGLIPVPGNKAILSPNTQLVITQKVEPEQGRASVATLSLEFIDYQGFMTEFVSPGHSFNEVLGGKEVKAYLGYQNTSFKEDYFILFRGYVSNVTSAATKLILQLSDANLKRRQQVFYTGKTLLDALTYNFVPGDVDTSLDRINVSNNYQGGNRIQFFSTGTLPAPLSSGVDYYILGTNPSYFKVSLTAGGSPVNITTQGTGNHTAVLFGIGTSAAKIYVVSNSDFTQQIQGPNGTYDSAITTYIKINDEIMTYGTTGFGSNFFTVTRGSRSTTISDHDVTSGNEVSNLIQIQDNVIDSSLKIMLSGWNGVWISNQIISSFVTTYDPDNPTVSNGIVLPDGVDAIEDYGLTIGDYVYTTGSGASNDRTCIVTGFEDKLGFPNNIILTDQTFNNEPSTSAVFSARSQYDVYPVNCGSKLKPTDVDVAEFQYIRLNYIFHTYDRFRILITGPQSGKEFIESQYLLPPGVYSLTRFGRISAKVTRPPLAGDNLVILNKNTVLDPQNIVVTRGLNNRRFFNNIQYFYDFDDSGSSLANINRLDIDSITVFDTNSVLPINALGLRSDLDATTFIDHHVSFILNRYKDVATEIQIKCNWKAASLTEVGDIIAIYDNGDLKIANFDTGTRDIGSQLFEVINRSISIKDGTGTLNLLKTSGYQVNDRFAGIAPTSKTDVGSTTSDIVIKDSFGALYPGAEYKKWTPIIGDLIAVHNYDYSFYEEVTLLGFVPGNLYHMLVSPPLSIAPPADYWIDCARYPTDTNPAVQAKTKLLFCFHDPTIEIVSGISGTQFVVTTGRGVEFNVGAVVMVHNADYSVASSEIAVDSIVGDTITLVSSLGFTPSSGMVAEFVGFKDFGVNSGGPYRVL